MANRKRTTSATEQRSVPTPLLNPQTPVDWWFLFKLNSAEEPGDAKPPGWKGLFDVKGWKRPPYDKVGKNATGSKKFSQHYLFASSANPNLRLGRNILGATKYDPLGATFGQVYHGSYYYVVWNDQFYGDPRESGGSPWGHSKGMVAWNEDGEGFVMQVSTPSWPASGSRKYPRQTDGNTLGYVRDDDIEVSQHFFALKLTKDDLIKVLTSMINARVVTGVSRSSTWDGRPAKIKNRVMKKEMKPPVPPLPSPLPPPPNEKQVVNNGGPEDVQKLVDALGTKPKVGKCTKAVLSSGVILISKPSDLAVPPWQLVSAQLGGVDLRVASWWSHPKIYTTTKKSATPECWKKELGKPGAVDIAISGTWEVKRKNKIYDANTGKWKTIPKEKEKVYSLGLLGEPNSNGNHAKFGVSTSKGKTFSIFGDMNQQGALAPGFTGSKCSSSQNGRGGLFYVMDDKELFASLTRLLEGESAPTGPPPPKSKKAKK